MQDDSKYISLLELNSAVRSLLNSQFRQAVWIQAQISGVSESARGHCYLELVTKDQTNKILAKAKANIWANNYRQIKDYFFNETGLKFELEMKIAVKVNIDFHEQYGYALNITDIDPAFTVGSIILARDKILKQLKADGVIEMNKELELTALPKNIAVISSSTAAGYDDFCKELLHNKHNFGYNVKLFEALMQGNEAEKSIEDAINNINFRDFDCVVIIRGGGAVSDLSCFDSYKLGYLVTQMPIPVIVGLGHNRDLSVLDFVAHTSVKTPTAVAGFLLDITIKVQLELNGFCETLNNAISTLLITQKNKLDSLYDRLVKSISSFITIKKSSIDILSQKLNLAAKAKLINEQNKLEKTTSLINVYAVNIIKSNKHKLELLQNKVELLSPQRLFERGYSLTLKDGKLVKVSDLKKGDELVTTLIDGEVKSIVQ